MPSDVFRLSPRITLVPILHGSGDFALQVRRLLWEESFDCLAVPLPPSFREAVESAIPHLPRPMLVGQPERPEFAREWQPGADDEDEEREPARARWSYVPVDPCQGVIMALRIAMQERIPRAFIDLETDRFQPSHVPLPDPYALKQVPWDKFATAVLPALPPLPVGQPRERVAWMAQRLRDLEQRFAAIVCLCSFSEWPWLRLAYQETRADDLADELVEPVRTLVPDPQTLLFMLGELPFITALYERARAECEDDANLSVDGVKELLVSARDRYRNEWKKRARKITPQMLSTYLKYVRNLTLLENRMTPDLYTLVTAGKQIAGDQFALQVAETARDYPYTQEVPFETIRLGIDRGQLPEGDLVDLVSRLPGQPLVWRNCPLNKRPDRPEQQRWEQRWDPRGQCSWPPEDEQIEQFRTCVQDRAKALLGVDLVRTEKFTTSIKDGIDIRDTLRNWHTGEIYVKENPPTRGNLDCVVMLFDTPADPREYPWRTTWYSEFDYESTLAFFASDFHKQMLGPGIAQANYGGAMFLYPPVSIPDIWRDRNLDFADTLEERLLAAACAYSRHTHIALLSAQAPGAGYRKLARRFGKRFIHVPLAQFSASKVAQLRMVHVLNGKHVRSYAANFIRQA